MKSRSIRHRKRATMPASVQETAEAALTTPRVSDEEYERVEQELAALRVERADRTLWTPDGNPTMRAMHLALKKINDRVFTPPPTGGCLDSAGPSQAIGGGGLNPSTET